MLVPVTTKYAIFKVLPNTGLLSNMDLWSPGAKILVKPVAECDGPDQESLDLVVTVHVLYLELLPLGPNRALCLWL